MTGAGTLQSYGWQSNAAEAEKDSLDELAKPGKLFDPAGRFKDFRDIPAADLTTRHFVVYWDWKGNTKILQGKEALDAKLDEIMKTLGP